MPIEDPRNLREVGIFLRAIETKVDGLKTDIANNNSNKRQNALLILSSIVSPCVVALLIMVFKNAFI